MGWQVLRWSFVGSCSLCCDIQKPHGTWSCQQRYYLQIKGGEGRKHCSHFSHPGTGLQGGMGAGKLGHMMILEEPVQCPDTTCISSQHCHNFEHQKCIISKSWRPKAQYQVSAGPGSLCRGWGGSGPASLLASGGSGPQCSHGVLPARVFAHNLPSVVVSNFPLP